MPKPWIEVASSDDFKALPPDQQDGARRQYFDDVVAPRVPNQHRDMAWEQFSTDTGVGRRALPAGVAPSTAGAGRGRVNPGDQFPVSSQPSGAPDVAFQDPSGGGDGASIMQVVQPKRESVLEGIQLTPPQFDPAEAERLSRREYAQSHPLPGDPRYGAPSMRASDPREAPSLATTRGAALQDASFPVRATAKAISGAAQGVGGALRAAGDFTGIDALKAAGGATAQGAEQFEKGMGTQGQVEGFGPKSPVPYLANMAEGAASSLAQSAAYASVFGPRAVIPLMSVMTAGEEYDKARNSGLTPAMALAGALPKGAFEAIGEKFTGLDKVAGAMGTLLTKGATAEAKKGAAEILIKSGIKEVPGEVITYLGQTGVDLLPGIGLNPNLTMGQFVDGLRDTVVQAGMMGSAMGAGGVTVRADPRIKRLRDAGETGVADLLQSKLDKQNTAASVEGELGGMAPLAEFAQKPEFQADYRQLRTEGVKPVEAAGRSALTASFRTLAASTGLSEKAMNAALEGAKKIGLDKLPGFFQRYTQSLAAKGVIQPVEGVDALGGELEAMRDHAMNAAMGAVYQPEPRAAVEAKPDAVQAVDNIDRILNPAPAGQQAAQPVSETTIPAPQGAAIVPQATGTASETAQVVSPEAARPSVEEAAHEAATSPLNDLPQPTEAQKEAGNYKVGRVSLHGLNISIENPKGSERSGTSPDGTKWNNTMAAHYGYIRGTEGNDGDHVDTFIGPNPESQKVFVVDQVNKDGSFDEHKVLLGADSIEQADALYHANYHAGWTGRGAITEMPIDQFKTWVKDGTKTKPVGDIAGAASDQDATPVGAEPAVQPAEGGDAVSPGPGDQVADAVAHLGRDGVPLSEGGKAFKTRTAADQARKLQPMMRVVRAPGGFALTEKTAAQIAAQEKSAARLRNPQTSPKGEPIPAHAMIAAAGGLSQSERADLGIGDNPQIGNRKLFASQGRGLTMEQATERLIEDGYLLEGAGHDQARALIKRSLTKPQYTAEGTERMAAKELEDRALAAQEAVADIEPLSDNEVQQIDDADIPWEAVSNTSTEAAMRALGFTDQEIQDAIADESGVQGQDSQGRGVADEGTAAETSADLGSREGAPGEDSRAGSDPRRQTTQVTQPETPATAGVSVSGLSITKRADGTLAVKGDPQAIRETLKDIPARSLTPMRGGILVGRTQADAAMAILDPAELTAPTREDIIQQQDRAEQATKDKEKADRATDKQARETEDRKRIAKASQAAADSFELGGDALDNLTGQQSIFEPKATYNAKTVAGEPLADYTGPYETDLFGDPLPTATGKDRAARSDGKRVQGNLQPARAVPDTEQPRGEFYVNTIVGTETSREVGAARIVTPEHAAQATSYLYKSAVERLDGIVTDKNYKPLAVIGGFKGAVSQTVAYPATLMAEAIRISGAAHVWFSHNHPSGQSLLSRADEALNKTLSDVFRGSGIEPMGLLAIAGDRYTYVDSQGEVRSERGIPPSTSKRTVPVMSRELVDSKARGDAISGPDAAKSLARTFYTKAKEPGLMLLNSQNAVAGWLPISTDMMGPLRDTGGAAQVYRAVSQSNAAAAIIVHGGELDAKVKGKFVTVSQNIAAALKLVDTRPLDSINIVTGESAAERGLDVSSGPMFARSAEFDTAVDAAIRAGTTNDHAELKRKVGLGISTPGPLALLGVDAKPVFTEANLIAKMHLEHGISKSTIKALPELLERPAMVFESDTRAGRYVMVLDVAVNGMPVLVAVEPNATVGRLEVVLLPSAYPKSNADKKFTDWIRSGKLLYADKEKSQQLATTIGLQLPGVVQRAVGFKVKYKTPADLPQAGPESGLARQFDAEAFRRAFAIPTPMTVTAVQKAVDELTAKWEYGPTVKVVHTPADLPVAAPRDARGFVQSDTAYIVATNHQTRDGIARTLGHEAIGHYGLWRMLGADGVRQFERNLQLAIKSGNVPLNKLSRKVRGMYVDESGNFNLTPGEEAREIAAFAVEDAIDPVTGEFKPGFGFVKAVYAKVAEFLRSIGINVKFTNAELHGMLISAMRGLEAGKRVQGGADVMVAAAREGSGVKPESVAQQSADPDTGLPQYAGSRGLFIGFAAPTERMEFIPTSDDQQMLNFVIMRDGRMIGSADLLFERGKLSALYDIEVDKEGRGKGDGAAVIQTLLAADPSRDVQISNIVESARGFWESVGIPQQNRGPGEAYDGNLNWETFTDSRAARRAARGNDGESAGAVPGSDAPATGAGQKGDGQTGQLARGPGDSAPQTDSPAFKRWFGDSKVVDAGGKPLVMYHGTSANEGGGAFTSFDTYASNYGLVGMGGYFTADAAVASSYTTKGRGESPTVYPAYLAIKNPIDMEAKANVAAWKKQFDGIEDFHEGGDTNEAWYRAAEDLITDQDVPKWEGAEIMQDGLRAMGFDGITHMGGGRMQKDGVKHRVYVAFDPEQIKSAIGNNGNFDQANPNIAFARGTSTAAPTGGGPATPTRTSAWRDAAGRIQFAPGAWLYDKLGTMAHPLLVKLQLNQASPELKRQIRQMKLEVQQAQETAVAVAKEANKLSTEERRMVSDIIEKELATGIAPPSHAVKLAATMTTAMSAQSAELVRLGMLTEEAAARWDGAYLPRFYESKLAGKVQDAWANALGALRGRTSAMQGIKGKSLKGRGLYEVVPAAELANYEALGWEKRDPDFDPAVNAEVQVWRDYTPAERQKMGEIRDAGFRFVLGYMQTQKDVALGRMFEGMASTMASRLAKPGYVRVPDTKVQGTGASRYGKLAGLYIPQEVMTHLSQVEESANQSLALYRKAMGLWKEGKTVLNPVSHVNNIVSNLSMAHFGGVSYHRADKYLAAMKDFATKSPALMEAKDAGLFLGTMSEAELLNTLPPELQALAKQADSTAARGVKWVYNAMSYFLRRPMGIAYQAEDTFFRYLLYKEARGRGMPANDAVDYAQRYIFTYDDLPKGARMVRDFAIPFFAYTYKAVPALLHTALTYPHRFAAPAAVLWMANAAAYAIAAGSDDDDSWKEALRKYLTDDAFRAKVREKEKLEREHLPPWMKGTTSLMSPKAIRLGMDELTKLPLFIDVSRIVPGGDIFDVSPNAGGLPIPQPITPSHPLFTTAVAMLGNKDLFFGKDIVDNNDTRGEATEKRSKWLWQQVMPAITAGNYHWDRTMNAIAQASGGEIKWLPEDLAEKYTGVGRDGLPVQPKLAAAQTFGIKVRPIDLEKSADISEGQTKKMISQIEAEMRSLRRLNDMGAISDRVYDKADDLAYEKKNRLRDGLTVDGDEKK